MHMKSTLALGAVLALIAAPAAHAGAKRSDVGRDTVGTQSGLVRGLDEGRFEQFLGLPYAAPPVRELRFAPPAAPAAWKGVRVADRQSPACLQFEPTGVREEQAVSEDCLYLDLYRPSDIRRKGKLPVLVWFHGGGNTQGTGVIYGGGSMAAKTDTIVISVNYRLGALGFLAHPALSAQTPGGSGNWATMDQMESLRWVQRNIAQFGGDPHNVTIYGQSAGGQAVCNMLAIPSAKGLFDRAIAESSPCTNARNTLAAGEASGEQFATAVGCTDPATVVACLRKAWPGTLIAHQKDYLGGAKVGGALFPVSPPDALRSGTWNKVPFMTGTTRSEDRLTSQALWPITAQGYVDRVNALYGAKAPQVLELYPLAKFKTPYDAITQVTTDAGRACQTEVTAKLMDGQVPTFRYEFNDPTSPTLYGFALPGEDMSNAHSGE
jgi:para-nitrobenzyl esterase